MCEWFVQFYYFFCFIFAYAIFDDTCVNTEQWTVFFRCLSTKRTHPIHNNFENLKKHSCNSIHSTLFLYSLCIYDERKIIINCYKYMKERKKKVKQANKTKPHIERSPWNMYRNGCVVYGHALYVSSVCTMKSWLFIYIILFFSPTSIFLNCRESSEIC